MHSDDKLRLSEERLRMLYRNSPAAIGLVRRADGVMLDINESYERMFGWRRDEVLGRSTEALRIWANPEERAHFRARIAREGRVTDFASKARRKDGEEFDSLLSSEVIDECGEQLLMVMVLDISERNRAEEALREGEQRFRALVELSSDWYWVTDAEHRFTFRDGEILRRMGIALEEDYGKRRWEIGFLNMDERAWAKHRAVLERREEFRDLLLERRSRDGRVHWATVSGRPLYDAQGRFVGYHGTGRDVTLQVRAEQHLRQLNEALEQKVAARTADLDAANRELEAFSYSVSHDLRAPLRAIDGFSSQLEERHAAALGEEARGYLRRMRDAARRMGQLIEDLLTLSRVGRDELRKRAVDLTALAKLVAKEIEAGAPERRIEWRIAEGLGAHADPGLMRVVLENLLGNAWKYSGRTQQAVIEFGKSSADEFIVRDNGAGFDAKYSDALFQPFRRLHAPQEFDGSGVGLATVRRIIERHGGTVRGEGAVGAGARFYFTLPPAPGF
jgi:PAS domain S-box-containing protein